MNSRPSKNGGNWSFFSVDVYALRRRHLVVYPTIAFQVKQSFVRNIIDEPAYFICMGFYYHFKPAIGIDNTYCCAIWIGKLCIGIWLEVVHPQFLAAAFKANRGSVVDIVFKKGHGIIRENRFFLFNRFCHIM